MTDIQSNNWQNSLRGTEEVLPENGLEAKLKLGKSADRQEPAFDPTAPDLHVGSHGSY